MPSRPLRKQPAIIKHEARVKLFGHFVEGVRRDFDMLDSRMRNKEMTAEEYAMSLRVHYLYFQGLTTRYMAQLAVEYCDLDKLEDEYAEDDSV